MKALRRQSLAKAIQLSLLIAVPGFAAAQDAPSPSEATTLDSVQVTGTRIKKAEIEGQVPVHTLTRADIERTGLTSIGDVVQQITGSGSGFNRTRNASGNDGFPSDGGGTGAGATTVDLRNLGTKRVLVLVDGMRWVNESSASGVGGATDLNTIPLAIVERIEVLEDGASSLYGSDAIAGVVNVITRRNFDGVQITANYGQYEDGDGQTSGVDLAWGGSSERASWFLGASYYDQQEVFSKDRARTRDPVFGTGLELGSTRVPGGRFRFVDPRNGGQYDLTTDPTLTNPTYTPGLPNCAGGADRPDGFRCFSGARDAFNYAQFNLAQTPSERAGVFGQFRFDLSDNLNWYARALFNRRDSLNQAAPEPIDIGPGSGTAFASNAVIPVNQPFNPFGIQLDPSNIRTIRRRPIEGGPRLFSQQVDTAYFGTGLEGTFDVGSRGWFWDANLAHSTNEAEQENRGSYNIRNIVTALGDPAVCAATPGCTPLDIFGFNTITPEMLAYISPLFRDRSENKLTLATANVSGDLFDMWAGPLSFATGYEYRKYEGSYDPDPQTVRGEYNGVPSLPTRGEYDVNEVYVELNVPLMADSSWGKKLDLNVAGRYSDYSTFGGEFVPKFGLRWQVVDEFLLRGTYAEGFRAPSIGELFGLGTRFDAAITDPCLGGNFARNAANCAALGVAPGQPQFDAQIGVNTGGTPTLEPERSQSFSMGMVWTPSFLEDSAIAKRVDFEGTFYKHRIEGAIQAPDPQTQLNLCVQTLDPQYCNGIVRNASTDQIEEFSNFLANFNVIKTDGWDFDVYWALPETAIGDFKVSWQNSWVGNYEAVGADGSRQPLQVGVLVSDPVTRSIPRWNSTATLDWQRNNWTAAWTARHVSDMTEDCSGVDLSGDGGTDFCPDNPGPNQNRLGSTTFHDVQVGYKFDYMRGLQLLVGANNVFGKDPPVCLSCNLNSFDGSTYDLPGGGFWYVRADLRF
ncbi:TonB-dependent receptor plug domain-containing protein [Lysobacter koreensis]|uniref:TonB-dependent receptor plug domain-containing protein n=1 Tax=Lysobacter koreensis TaxID=266122 RepID=A0ABW2YR83_9GAMM